MKSLRQSNKGFTLVEICVTLVIFSLLATVSTMSLLHWQEYSVYTKQQENAEILYMAARNKIAQLRADNTWQDFKKKYFNNQVQCVFRESQNDSSSQTMSKLYYAYCSKDDYEFYFADLSVNANLNNKGKKKFIENSELNKTGAALVYSLITDFVHDKKVLNSDIVIAFFDDGTIYAIYYSDRENLSLSNGYVDIDKLNNQDSLYDNCIGAYLLN